MSCAVLLNVDAANAASETGEKIPVTSLTPLDLRLDGVLISDSNRSALINGRVVREGDFVDHIQITEISPRGIRAVANEESFSMRIGGKAHENVTTSRHSLISGKIFEISRTNQPARQVAEDLAALDILGLGDTSTDNEVRYTVKSGETLSHIAQAYSQPDESMFQLMDELYKNNKHAFGDSADDLRAGAVLSIPAYNDRNTVQTADVYGPVKRGESLSEISARVLPDNVTMNQMMIAIFEANTHAFNGNINQLLEGTVIRIPNESVLHEQPADMATAEVIRQTEQWLSTRSLQARRDRRTSVLIASISN